jgi:TPP-dependent pyruvate/acetoin dehydrogenase alpha subunit
VAKCPIQRLSHKLIKEKLFSRKALDAVDKEITAAIDQAVEFATQSAFPAIEEMYEDVYVSEGTTK